MSIPPEPPEKKVLYTDFKEFYDRHPDMDNSEYYAEFPTSNKSTIRTWKNRAAFRPLPEPPTPPSKDDPYTKDYFQMLLKDTGTDSTEFNGVDMTSAIIILKNRQEAQQKQKPAARPGNTGILPSPRPIGQSTAKFAIDPYIVFDGDKNEIRMEIPLDEVMDPKKNKELSKIYR